MSTDRELLELAAKAIGEKCEQMASREFGLYKPMLGVMQPYVRWNPLADDGDALRLAVKLRLDVDVEQKAVYVSHSFQGYGAMALLGADPYAATRRAIVRAAAEIGRTMV